MKVRILTIVIAFVLILGAGFLLGRNTATAPTKSPMPTLLPTQNTPKVGTSSGKRTEVRIFLVALNNSGESTESFGCGDSIVPVLRTIAPTTMPLTAAVTELLSIKSQSYGQSGLYNALYQSNLKVEKATVVKGVATVYLTGSLRLGGVCDDPRVETQLTQTVMQFSTVKQAKIYINNIPLHAALSEK